MKSYFLAVFLGFSVLSAIPAWGNPIGGDASNRAYARRTTQSQLNDITGAKAVLTGGWNHLLPIPLTGTTNLAAFLNKDMWLVLDSFGSQPISGGCWIEVMVKNGYYSTATGKKPEYIPSYKGYSIASNVANNTGNMDYIDYPYGTNPSSTAQTGGTVEIVKGPSAGQWIVKINGVNALTLGDVACRRFDPGFVNVKYIPNAASRIDWGIESNDTANTFTKNTTMTVQQQFGTGSYTTPPSAAVPDTSNNTFGWSTTYNNGTITFTRP